MQVREQLFFEDSLKDFANDRYEAGGPSSVVQGFFATGVTIARRQFSGTWTI